MPAPNPDPRVFEVLEQTSGAITGLLVDNDGVTPIPSAALLTLTLTLYVIKTDGTTGIVNSRNAQSVLNLNNVTITSGGIFTWIYQALDTTLVEALAYERHIALFRWTTTTAAGACEIVLNVRNLVGVS